MKLGFIGAGNMGAALARAAAKNCSAENIGISNRTAEKAEALCLLVGAQVSSNIEIARKAKYIVLGVKPQVLPELFSEIAPVLRERKDRYILVTMAAGTKIERIQTLAENECAVIRIMPNTPSSIGEGMLLYSESSGVTEEEKMEFLDIFKYAGMFDEISENLIDAASAVSGCGPAFVYMFAEAMADGGVKCGLPRKKALMYAAQTLVGAAKLMLESGDHPGRLKDDVCSPGGSTIAGVMTLEEGAFRASAMKAVCAAYEKTVSLGK